MSRACPAHAPEEPTGAVSTALSFNIEQEPFEATLSYGIKSDETHANVETLDLFSGGYFDFSMAYGIGIDRFGDSRVVRASGIGFAEYACKQ